MAVMPKPFRSHAPVRIQRCRAKRAELIQIIRDLRRCVVIEASGGEGERDCNEVPWILARANAILRAETQRAPCP